MMSWTEDDDQHDTVTLDDLDDVDPVTQPRRPQRAPKNTVLPWPALPPPEGLLHPRDSSLPPRAFALTRCPSRPVLLS